MRKALPLTTPQQIDDSAPLVGIRVIEFGNYIAAPYAGRLLAAQGAEVIKVEHPAGDPMRLWESSGNVSTQFVAYNAGKLGVSLDMTRPESTSLAQSLIRSSHIVLTNLRPDVTARFKLDFWFSGRGESKGHLLRDYRIRSQRDVSEPAKLRHGNVST